MMVVLTTQQRDLLRHLLTIDAPIGALDMASKLALTPRQVRYRLKATQGWLSERNVTLETIPGVGVTLECSDAQRHSLLRELDSGMDCDLVLSPGQRQQLLALTLLTADSPLILRRLQADIGVSRTTVLKDLDEVEAWFESYGLTVVRRPNYGVALAGAELVRRQALAALLWGDVLFDDPLITVTYDQGLEFTLADDATLLPIVRKAAVLIKSWDVPPALEYVAAAESQFGGRFTDNGILGFSLALAIQAQRVRAGLHMQCQPADLAWLKTRNVWEVAAVLAEKLWPDLQWVVLEQEIAGITMLWLSCARSDVLPGDLNVDAAYEILMATFLEEAAKAFFVPRLREDTALRDGLTASIIPALLQQRFGLWGPPSLPEVTLAAQYKREFKIARELASDFVEPIGVALPESKIADLALLLRAAYLRSRSTYQIPVFVVCDSGMATAQLLVARLKARFPSMNILGVLAVREVSAERVAAAQLLISTVPLESPVPGLPVIQVEPLLLPEGIETLTRYLGEIS